MNETPVRDFTGQVVLGTTGAEQCATAEFWGAAFAARRRLPVLLLGAFGHGPTAAPDAILLPQITEDAQLAMTSYLEQMRTNLQSQYENLDVGVEAAPGHAGPWLADASRSADLVVVGTRGLNGLSGLLLGSTSQYLVTHARGPVAVVPSSLTEDLTDGDPIVLGVDGESDSAATEFAFEQARTEGRPLVAVHSWEPGDRWADRDERGPAVPTDDHLDHVLKETLAQHTERFPEVEVRRQVVRGQSDVALLGASARAAMLVVGTHGRGEVRGLLFGSTSMRLFARASCPAIVVPERTRQQ
ncbi:universal stress protein [Gephyromycinifex aptenodytis]|uniref:universal stress protein n=1 Tax=Gephyromycinifex aptenodytis TaxID=2716227 RepID=UPI0014450010|nr:universal stress protein [Gephyromycinifex aptenodytis]